MRFRRFALLLLFYLMNLASPPGLAETRPGQIGGWPGGARFDAPRPAGDDADLCIRAILAAERRFGIPDNLLLAIGLTEAGRTVGGGVTVWPWTINADGRGWFFDSRSAAAWAPCATRRARCGPKPWPASMSC